MTGIKAVGGQRPAAADLSIRSVMDEVSLEATPKQLQSDLSALKRLKPGTRVYLPYLKGNALADSVEPAKRLAAMGLHPVPHVSARALKNHDDLKSLLELHQEAEVDTLLLIAGDLDTPAGPFASTLQVLDTDLLHRYGIKRLAVAGHPEGHPFVASNALADALRAKQVYAGETSTEMWIVTQFVFQADAAIAYEAHLRDLGVELPVHLGVPGPATMKTLLTYALQCGVGVSARMLAKRPGTARLFGRWQPDGVIKDLAAHQTLEPKSLISGLHLFPFGGLLAALDWLERTAGAVDLKPVAPFVREAAVDDRPD